MRLTPLITIVSVIKTTRINSQRHEHHSHAGVPRSLAAAGQHSCVERRTGLTRCLQCGGCHCWALPPSGSGDAGQGLSVSWFSGKNICVI